MDVLDRDVFSCILDFCEVNQSLRPLQRVCKSFYAAIFPRLWHEIRKPPLAVLEVLSAEGSRCAPHVRVLELVTESSRDRQEPDVTIDTIKQFNERLEGTLKNCRGLVEFTYRCETEFALPASFAPLAEMTELTRLNIEFQSGEVAETFRGGETGWELYKQLGVDYNVCVPLLPKNLRSLEIDCTGAMSELKPSIENLAQTLRSSTRLEEFIFSMPNYRFHHAETEQGYDWAFRDLCMAYAAGGDGGADGPPAPLKLKTLNLRQSVFLTAADDSSGADANYLGKMVDLEHLKEFSLFSLDQIISRRPEPTARFEDWAVLKPAKNLEALDICGVTAGVKAFFTGNADLGRSLRRLDVMWGEQDGLVELLGLIGTPLQVTELQFVCPEILVDEATVDAIVANLPLLETLKLNMSPRRSLSILLPTPTYHANALGQLQHLKVLELQSAKISYCWKWPPPISDAIKENQGAFRSLEKLTAQWTHFHVAMEVPEGSTEPVRVLKETGGDTFATMIMPLNL